MTQTSIATPIELAPVFVLIDYAYAVLNANDSETWDKTKYDGLIPIVPLNEEPELSEFPGPRIVYEYAMQSRLGSPYRGRGTVTFAVRDHNYRRMTKALNILDESFNREDESARDLNWFTDQLRTRPVNPIPFNVSFGSMRVAFVESGAPETEEGGMMVGVISVSFEYFTEYAINTRPVV